jgi:hypothetical protein
MDPKDVIFEDLHWIHMAQYWRAVLNAVMNLRVP